MSVDILAVIMVFGIPMLAILGWILLSALRILMGESKSGGGRTSSEETRIMQEIHHGLSNLEKRVEALETLLLDRARMEREPRERV